MLLKFYRSFLLLSGDISLNHGPCSMQFIDDKTWEAIKTQENFFKFYWTCFLEILIPKVNPIAIGTFYRLPNANEFLRIFSNDFQQIDSKTNEIYLLGDFNINLPQNGKFILKEISHINLKIPALP